MPKKYILAFFSILFVLLAGLPSYYFYAKYKQAQFAIQNSTAASQEETKTMIAKIGVLMELPSGEAPTLATVTDADKLRTQAFFANSSNGDKVLIYTQTKKAILYRPSINKIIDVASVSIGAPATSSAVPQRVVANVKIILYNGTEIVGLTKKYETALKAKVNNVDIVDRDNAKSTKYDKTTVIDLTGTKSVEAKQLADAMGGVAGELPKEEVAPNDADFLIIVGSDFK